MCHNILFILLFKIIHCLLFILLSLFLIYAYNKKIFSYSNIKFNNVEQKLNFQMHLYSEYNKGIIRTGKTIAQMNNKQVKIKKKICIYK